MKNGVCPYDKSHVMSQEKLIHHIAKGCKAKQLYGHNFEKCIYNSLHIIPKNQMNVHYYTCSNRKQFANQEFDNQIAEKIKDTSRNFKKRSQFRQRVAELKKQEQPQQYYWSWCAFFKREIKNYQQKNPKFEQCLKSEFQFNL